MTTHATITYSCGGCDAIETIDPIWMRAKRESAFGGKLVKILVKPTLDVELHAPDGWIVFDPYTLCTYCPDCWANIEGGD